MLVKVCFLLCESQSFPDFLFIAINKAFKRYVYLDITHDNDDLKHFEIFQPTSVSILQKLTHWALHSMDFPNVTWLHGVSAAEKTAISVSFAEMLAKEDRLAASFFFPRADTRNLKKSFIPSIAYQICFAIPELAQHVLEAAEKDPVIFGKSLETQMRELIIQPVLSSGLAAAGRWIVVIDGLDTFVTPGDDFAKRVSTIMSDLVPQLEGRLRFCISGWQTSGISREFASCTAVKPLEIYSPDYWATCTVYIGFFF